MSPDYWKKDLIMVNPGGSIYYTFGTAEYQTEEAAKAAPLPSYSDQLLSDGNAFIATIILKKAIRL